MVKIGRFEEELTQLKNIFRNGSYDYVDPSKSFKSCTTSHFTNINWHERYGVYVVRQKSTLDVLYIGRAGTVNSEGNFKSRDIPGRLKNVKGGDMNANEWFETLRRENGPLVIEYIFLSKSMTPRLLKLYYYRHT